MKETKKTAKRTKMAAVSMALAAMMAGQTVVVMAGESDSNVLYTFPLTDGIEIEASTMDFNRDKTQYIDQVYEERTNVKIDWNISPVADWSTTLNLRLNSGAVTVTTSKLTTVVGWKRYTPIAPAFVSPPANKCRPGRSSVMSATLGEPQAAICT